MMLFVSLTASAQAQAGRSAAASAAADNDHEQERARWFSRGRETPGKSAAELRHRAYKLKMQARQARIARDRISPLGMTPSAPSGGWTPLGPVPLASDATGTGFQDYHQVAGRATSVVIDPADASGNTVFIGGAQGGVWKSTNAATSIASSVTWSSATDDQATLSIGALAIQPGNSDPNHSVVLAATGEANNSGDSYFGLGILRSADGGITWTLIPSANNQALSFSGLGGTRVAFSTASAQTNTAVAAMAATGEGVVDGALTANTYRGLYTSTDAGQTWTYDSLFSGGASEATSATSVAYNATAGLFFAALRYHGFYSSPDGLTWTRLANQPGAPGLLSTTTCPQNYASTCPIYRGEITVVPGRNEMYAWFVSLDSNNNPVDQGIWQSLNAGASWIQISDSGIINCGDFNGCGVQQGFYNLALLAVPNGPVATDLYAGAINLYKCSISPINPYCSTAPFVNLTHVYGCDPLGALAHVHPDQHALAYMIASSSGADLMYFANDGGIYRALNGFTGLTSGSCSVPNQFDDLNQNLGSMTQFVSFSEHPTDPNTIFGGSQDNGSPATATATSSLSWGNILSGDGGYNAIDSNTGNWFASNPDTPPGGGNLNIQQCSSGTGCNDGSFNVVVSSADVGGDDGPFYFPYILDPQSASSMLIGTCRVWRGSRSGGAFTALSLNFQTFGTGTCAGDEVNTIRALASGGPTDANGSQVIYATTDGPGLNNLSTPPGGNVWVTTKATAVSGTTSTFADVTLNGPAGSSINPDQFPISAVGLDSSDATGNTAYVTVMGFTGGTGHIWQTKNAGASWLDFTGSGANGLPDSPVNAVVIDSPSHTVYVGTDVGVFQSPTSSATWSELGPSSAGQQSGFLPDVAVTALGIFNSGGQKLLRASTYGRGVWQYNLLAVPDFQISVPAPTLTTFPGAAVNFVGTVSSINGYNNSVLLSCTPGSSSPPVPCIPTPGILTPTPTGVAFSLNTGSSVVGDYFFNLQGAGTDPNNTTHLAPLTLHVVNLSMTTPVPSSVIEPRGVTSPPVSFTVTAQGSFNQSVTLSCNAGQLVAGATCAFTPSPTFNLTTASPVNATATVTMPAGTPLSPPNYTVIISANTAGEATPVTTSFTVDVVANPTFVITEPGSFPLVKAGSTGTTGPITISSQDGFTGTVNLSCVSTFGTNSCSISPASVSSFPATATLTINGTSFSPGTYQVSVMGTSGLISNSLAVPFSVGDYTITGTQAFTAVPGSAGVANLTLTSIDSYSGSVVATCDATTLPGAKCTLSPLSPITVGNGAVVGVTATVNVPTNAAAGNYTITLNTHDSAGEPVHAWTMTLTVQDFAFGPVTPPAQSIGAGQSAVYNLIVMPVGTGFGNAVSFTCAGAPAGSTCSFVPNSVTPGNGSVGDALTILTSSSATPGSYTVVITGTAGSVSHSTSLTLIIGNSFQLAVTQPFPAGADAGSQQQAKISLTPQYTGSVNASCDATALGAGAVCTLTPPNPIAISGSPVTITVLINIPNNAAPGPYVINVDVKDAGSSGVPDHSVSLPLTVIQDFTFGQVTPPVQTIGAGQSATYDLTVLPVGTSFTGTVNLACASPPPNSTCSFAPQSITPGNNSAGAVMTVTTSAAIPQGNYNVVITGTSGTLLHSETATLVVSDSLQLAIVHSFPAAVTAGSMFSGTVSITPNYTGSIVATCDASALAATQCTLMPANPIAITSSPITLTASVDIGNNAAPGPYKINVTVHDTGTNGVPTSAIALPFSVVQDYAIENLSSASQTITAGQSITYNLAVAPVGASYGNSVTLSCTGSLGFNGTCTFSPNPTSPLSGSTSAAVLMTVTTQAARAQLPRPSTKPALWPYAVWLTMAAVAFGLLGQRRSSPWMPLAMTVSLLFFSLSCGGGGNNGSSSTTTGQQGAPVTYTITVTGSPASISQPGGAAVTLIVNP
jgi:uncharacterized membrane protein